MKYFTYDRDFRSVRAASTETAKKLEAYEEGVRAHLRASGLEPELSQILKNLAENGHNSVADILGGMVKMPDIDIYAGEARSAEILISEQVAAMFRSSDAVAKSHDGIVETTKAIGRLYSAIGYLRVQPDVEAAKARAVQSVVIARASIARMDEEKKLRRAVLQNRIEERMVAAAKIRPLAAKEREWLSAAEKRKPAVDAAREARDRVVTTEKKLCDGVYMEARDRYWVAEAHSKAANAIHTWSKSLTDRESVMGRPILIPVNKPGPDGKPLPEKALKTGKVGGLVQYLTRGMTNPDEIVKFIEHRRDIRPAITEAQKILDGSIKRYGKSKARIEAELLAEAVKAAAIKTMSPEAQRALSWAKPRPQDLIIGGETFSACPGGNVARHRAAIIEGGDKAKLARFDARLELLTQKRDAAIARCLDLWDHAAENSLTIPQGRTVIANRRRCGPGAAILWSSPDLPLGSARELAAKFQAVPANLAISPTKSTITSSARFHHLPISIPDNVPDNEITDQRMLSIATAVVRLSMGIDISKDVHTLVIRHDDSKHRHIHVFFSRVRKEDGKVHDMDSYMQWRTMHLANQLLTALFLRKHGADHSSGAFAPIILANARNKQANDADDCYLKLGKKDGFRIGWTWQEDPTKHKGKTHGHWDDEDAERLFTKGDFLAVQRLLGREGMEDIAMIPAGFVKEAKRAKPKREKLDRKMTKEEREAAREKRSKEIGLYEACAEEFTSMSPSERKQWLRVEKREDIRAVLLVEHLLHMLIENGEGW